MANEQNLIPNSQRSPSEVRNNSSKGGKKSGEVRRKRKALREELEAILSQKANNDKTYQECMSLALIKEAFKGNVKAFEVIRDTIGEKPIDKVEATTISKVELVDDIHE